MDDLTISLRIENLLVKIDPSYSGMRDTIKSKPYQTIMEALQFRFPDDAKKIADKYEKIANFSLAELQADGFDIEELICNLKEIADNADSEKSFEVSSNNTKSKIILSDKSLKIIDKVFLACFIAGIVGVVLFLGIVIIGAIAYGRVYLFDGYGFTKALTIISILLMLIGLISVSAKIVTSLIFKIGNFPTTIFKRVVLILLAATCFAFSVWGFTDCAKTANKDSNSSSSSSSSSSSTVSEYIGLSLKVTSITTSGSYTYVYCSVQNVSALYGPATMYRYIKVKAVFYNSANSIVDTDWTYAIDSAWLNSGETKTFYYMVNNTTIKSAKLSIIN